MVEISSLIRDAWGRTGQYILSCLAEEADFSLKELYELNSNEFELAIEVLEEWRLDRFYMGKAKLFDVAQQALEIGSSKK